MNDSSSKPGQTPDSAAAVRDNAAEQRFELRIDDDIAIADYQISGDRIVFPHTFVPPRLRGRGLATRLVVAALDSARARGLKVDPQCSMFARYMQGHAETHELLSPTARKALLG